jgi:hypothetical protein
MALSNKLPIGVFFYMRVITAAISCLFAFISLVQAEQPYDITACHSGTIKRLYASREITVLSGEGWGIIMSNHEKKIFDNCTFHVMTLIQTMGDKITETGFVKIMDPDGDLAMAEMTRVGTESISKFIYGTGKYKGITGGGKSQRIVYGRIPPDAAAACSRLRGTFELPK